MRITCIFATLLVLAGAPAVALAACGDGVIDAGEACDGANLNGQDCNTLTAGFVQGGTLACNPDCTFNTTDCRRAFLESLLPARGGGKNRCQLEWGTVGTTNKGAKRACTEGDDSCDTDKSFNNVCTVKVQLCVNVPDPKINGCPYVNAAGRVFQLAILPPALNSDVNAAVLGAAKDLGTGAGSTAHVSGNTVSYSPPITTFSCGSSTVRVPLRGTAGHARPGKVKIRAKSSDNSGRIKAVGALNLICNP